MDIGIFDEVQVASPLKHRERERQASWDVMDHVVAAEQAGFDSFWSVEHHFQPGFSHSSAPEVLHGPLEASRSGRAAADIAAHPNREVTEYEGLDPRQIDLQSIIDKGMFVVGDADTCIRQIERVQQAPGSTCSCA